MKFSQIKSERTIRPARVMITGASSGLGMELALEYARHGCPLGLIARRDDALSGLADRIRSLHGAEYPVHWAMADVCDVEALQQAMMQLRAALGGVDRVIANAGIATGHRIGSGHLADDLRVMRTNVEGLMGTLDLATSWFLEDGQGQLVAISSVAARRGMPGAASYCASKAAVATYMEALRAELHGTSILCTTLFPGYIDTPLNQHLRKRPFLIDAAQGARIMVDLIEKGVRESMVPALPWTLIGKVLQWAPDAVIARQ